MFFREGFRESRRTPGNVSRYLSVTKAGTASPLASTKDESRFQPWFWCPDWRAVRQAGTFCSRRARGWQAALRLSEQSYDRWRKEYGGLRTDQAKLLKDLEKENGRLRKAISDLTLDKLILKEALEGNC